MLSVNLPAEAERLARDYQAAREAAAKWTAHAKHLRETLDAILEVSGYAMDSTDLTAEPLEALAGTLLVKVNPTPRTTLNQKLLQRDYPEAWNACQTRSVSYRVQVGGTNPDGAASLADDGDG